MTTERAATQGDPSAAASCGTGRAAPRKPLAPSRRLVLAHMGVGLLGLIFFAGALLHGAHAARAPSFQPLLLGLVHALVLGWLLPTAIGALHRLSPLLLGDTIGSERASWLALALYVVGASGVTGHLWMFATGWGLPCSALLLASAILLYTGNFGVSLVRGWARSGPSGLFVGAALGWLTLTALLGAALAWNLHAPFIRGNHMLWLKGHAHAGALGFFGLLVMGAALRLLEMFLVSHGASAGPARWAWAATNAAVAALVLGFTGVGPEELVQAGAVLGAAGVALFMAQAHAIHRRRIARRLDHALRHTAAAFAWLVLAAATGASLALDLPPAEWRPHLETAYGALALLGFVGSIITGQLYRILPSLLAPTAQPPLVRIRSAGAAPDAPPPVPLRLWMQWGATHAGVLVMTLGLALEVPAFRVVGAALFVVATVLFVRDVWDLGTQAGPLEV